MKQSTTPLKFAWLASASGTCHVELDKLPKLNTTKSTRSPKRLAVEFVFFRFTYSNRKSRPAWRFTFRPIRCKSNKTKKISEIFTVIGPCTVRFFQIENPTVRFGGVLENRKSYGAVRFCDKSYGAVRSGFQKSEILRCGSVRFQKIENLTMRFGFVVYDTVRFGSVPC